MVCYYESAWDFLVAPIPIRVILATDWMRAVLAVWDIERGSIHVKGQSAMFQLPCIPYVVDKQIKKEKPAATIKDDERETVEAYQQMIKAIKQMGQEEAEGLARPSPIRTWRRKI